MTLSTQALKDSLNKQKAINTELKTQIDQLKQHEQAILQKASENDTTEAVLREEKARQEMKEKELNEKEKKIQEQLQHLEEKQRSALQATEALNKREAQFKKAQTIFSQKYKDFKTQQAQRNATTTYKIHIPINGTITGDPITNTNTCFSDITCGHINVTMEDTKIKTITWRNQQNTKRPLTHDYEINSEDETEEPTTKRPRLH